MAQWYYLVNNQQQGPISSEQLKELSANGTVTPQTYVWREGLDDWKPANMVQGLFGQAGAPAGEALQASMPQSPPAQATASSSYPSASYPVGAVDTGPNAGLYLGLSIGALIISCCLCCPIVTAIPALIFAIIAMSKKGGGDMAGAYSMCGYAKILLWVTVGLMAVSLILGIINVVANAGMR